MGTGCPGSGGVFKKHGDVALRDMVMGMVGVGMQKTLSDMMLY